MSRSALVERTDFCVRVKCESSISIPYPLALLLLVDEFGKPFKGGGERRWLRGKGLKPLNLTKFISSEAFEMSQTAF